MSNREVAFSDYLKLSTGFPYAVFLQSGSAALELSIEIFNLRNRSMILPAIGCWTLYGACKRSNVTTIWQDVGACLEMQLNSFLADSLTYVVPWGSGLELSGVEKFKGVKIIDLTLSPNANWEEKPAKVFDAGIISFGSTKSLSADAGGVLLLNSIDDYRLALQHLSFGKHINQWLKLTNRYTFSKHLLPILSDSWDYITKNLVSNIEQRKSWMKMKGSKNNFLTPVDFGESYRAGYTTLLPHIIDDNFPLNANELYRIAMAENFPIVLQPVTPAYGERPGGKLNGICEQSESKGTKLVFIPVDSLSEPFFHRTYDFMQSILMNSDPFKLPYDIIDSDQVLPEAYSHWVKSGILMRKLDESFLLYDSFCGKSFSVPMDIANALQKSQSVQVL